MTQKENGLLEKAALAAFGALMAKDTTTSFKARAVMAWEAAGEYMKARAEYKGKRYDIDDYINDILNEHNETEALRMILQIDGNTGRALDFVLRQFIDKPEPLRAYADADIGCRKTKGQIAIRLFLLDRDRRAYRSQYD